MANVAKIALAFLLVFSFGLYSHQPAMAEGHFEKQKHLFLAYESKIYDLIEKGLKPLENLDTAEDNATLKATITEAEKAFGDASTVFSKLNAPHMLPVDVKQPLDDLNKYFSLGFKALERSMGSFLTFLDRRDPAEFDSFVLKLEEGISFIDGGLTSLATQKMRLFPEMFHGKDTWVLAKKRLYDLRPR